MRLEPSVEVVRDREALRGHVRDPIDLMPGGVSGILRGLPGGESAHPTRFRLPRGRVALANHVAPRLASLDKPVAHLLGHGVALLRRAFSSAGPATAPA